MINTFTFYVLSIALALLCKMSLVRSSNFETLDPDLRLDKDTYCEVCKATSRAIFDLVMDEENNHDLEDNRPEVCVFKYLKHLKDKNKVRNMMKACNHLTDEFHRGEGEMFAMVKELIDTSHAIHTEVERVMCILKTDACVKEVDPNLDPNRFEAETLDLEDDEEWPPKNVKKSPREHLQAIRKENMKNFLSKKKVEL